MKRYLILLGATGILAQILLLRELSITFYGNELFLSTTLASWLLLTALGSALLGRVADRLPHRVEVLIASLCGAGALTPFTIVAVRAAGVALLPEHGVAVSFGRMLTVTLLLLAPLCLVLGFLFTLACRVLMDTGRGRAASAGQVYVLEAVGTAVAGVLFSFMLVELLPTFQLGLALAALDAIAAFVLWLKRGRRRAAWGWLMGFWALVLLALVFSPIGMVFDRVTQKFRLPGYVIEDSWDTPYGHVNVATQHGQVNFFESGLIMGHTEDEAGAELVAHLPMLLHEKPNRVLLIGGGFTGVLRKLREHPVQQIDYVELDPKVIAAARRYARAADRRALASHDVRVKGKIDARLYVKRYAAAIETQVPYDVIIVNLPDPSTGLINRFYTREFFTECGRILRPNGLLAIGLSGGAHYISPALGTLSASIYRTLRSTFRQVIVVSTDARNFFFSTNAPQTLSCDAKQLARRLHRRGLRPLRVDETMLHYLLDSWTRDQLLNRLNSARHVQINTDYRPISYYYVLLHWQSMLSGDDSLLLQPILRLRLWWVLLAAGLVAAALGLVGARLPNHRLITVPAALAGSGFVGILLEVALIFAFQSLYGHVYQYVGLMFASFMVGLAVGGWLIARRTESTSDAMWPLILTQTATTAYAVLVSLALVWFQADTASIHALRAVGVGFPLLNLGAGLLVGMQFPLAVKARRGAGTQTAGAAGLLYGADLLGSCAGALLAGVVLIPVLGITGACHAAALVGAVSAALLVVAELVAPGS